MNIFRRDGGLRRHWRSGRSFVGFAVVCLAVSASAVDPNRTAPQYLRDSWGSEKGFQGSISAIEQTPDGYLWIGTDNGLVRFDGLNFQKFEHASPSSFPIGAVQTLKTDRQGNLWVLLRSTKLLRYHEGAFELSRGEAENGVTAMGLGAGGSVLLSSLPMGTLTYKDGRFESVSSVPASVAAQAGSPADIPDERSAHLSWTSGVMPDRLVSPNSAVISIAATTDGRIWWVRQDGGLFYLKEGRVFAVRSKLPNTKFISLLPLDNGELWIGTQRGLVRWNGFDLTSVDVPSALRNVEVLSMIRDRDANVWAGTTRGLLRLNANGVSLVSTPETSGPITALFEDREGNLWIGSARGLVRLRDTAFVSYLVAGVKSQSMGPLYVDLDGRTWVAPVEGGLRWLKGGAGGGVRAAGLADDIIYSIVGSKRGDLWVGRQEGGLTHLHYVQHSVTAKTYTVADGLAQNSVYAVYESRDGTVWAATLSAGVSELRDGHFTNYTIASGLASDTVSAIAESGDETMWFGTPGGLSALSKNGWRTYSVKDGLPSPDVNCLLPDSTGVLWIGTAEGLVWLAAGKVHIPHGVPDSLREAIFGIVEDRNGRLWVATASHVLQVTRGSLLVDRPKETELHEYGLADGLQGTEGVKRFRSVVTDSKGRIWFSTNRGLAVVNPVRGTVNPAPALVQIDTLSADGSPLDLRSTTRVPAATQRITFRYVGLSLSNSERVRYRYRLDSFDKGWSEPVANREATYGNLGAGKYRFRVMASNGDGMWNGPEAAVGFEVEPTLWQTWWFRLACVGCAVLVVLLVYRLRMRRLAQLLNVRFEERLRERTLIAQELHDTLLQGVVSVSMQLHVVADQLPDDLPVRTTMNQVLRRMGQVVEEGSNTLRGLGSSIESADDLKSSLLRIPEELGYEEGIAFRVLVEGISKPLRPAVRDDVYRIAREALVNAFRHSGASNIDLYLEYAARQLRIVVRDDGSGFDPQVLHSGRDGQRGLPWIRERADRMGARIRVFSRTGGGTEVELRVPSNIAFETDSSTWFLSWLMAFKRWQKKIEPSP